LPRTTRARASFGLLRDDALVERAGHLGHALVGRGGEHERVGGGRVGQLGEASVQLDDVPLRLVARDGVGDGGLQVHGSGVGGVNAAKRSRPGNRAARASGPPALAPSRTDGDTPDRHG
jgi:hypothetical protein